MKNKKLGLIGYPLTHSFSAKYFSDKFRNENIEGYSYENFEIPKIDAKTFSKSDDGRGIELHKKETQQYVSKKLLAIFNQIPARWRAWGGGTTK